MPAERRLTVRGACYTISSKPKSPGRPDCQTYAGPQNQVANVRWRQAVVGGRSDVSKFGAIKIKEVSQC
jgi:hypothetical protein